MTGEQLVESWRIISSRMRKYGGVVPAAAIEQCADELEEVIREGKDESLTIAQGAYESGYSVAHLRRLVREEKVPNAGKKNSPRVRRGDLPRKPPTHPPQEADVIRCVLQSYE